MDLVYTKTVDSVFHALWLATQSVNILHYSLIHLQFLRASDAKVAYVASKMPSRFAAVTNKEISQLYLVELFINKLKTKFNNRFLQNDFKYKKNSQLLLKKFPRKS